MLPSYSGCTVQTNASSSTAILRADRNIGMSVRRCRHGAVDRRLSERQDPLSPRQTALGRLLQDRREAAGYSRARIGDLVGIKPGTIEGWELGRVSKPPIHDVLRLAHFL